MAVETECSDEGLQKNVDGSFIAMLNLIWNQLLDQIDKFIFRIA